MHSASEDLEALAGIVPEPYTGDPYLGAEADAMARRTPDEVLSRPLASSLDADAPTTLPDGPPVDDAGGVYQPLIDADPRRGGSDAFAPPPAGSGSVDPILADLVFGPPIDPAAPAADAESTAPEPTDVPVDPDDPVGPPDPRP